MSIAGSKVTIEGHAIIAEDGSIAAPDGSMPDSLRNDADWRSFQAALDGAALVVLGRLGHTRHPNPGRRRLVLTHSVDTFAPDPGDPRATFWNPGGIGIADMLHQLGIAEGVVAITGGTGAFDLFVPHYDGFVLSEVRNLFIAGGVPCFSVGHPRFVLPGAGLTPTDMAMIDRGVVQTRWVRGATPIQPGC